MSPREMVAFVVMIAVCLGLSAKAPAQEPTYAERLGWPPGSRVVIFHVDDGGMSHDSNTGVLEAMTKGVATSTSVMFPCPWVSELAQIVKDHPNFDVGVHTTLTSEWSAYRWGPVAGKKAVPGLVDEEGCLWHSVPQVAAKATPDEVETEIRAQIDRAITLGIKPTHIDVHMGTPFAKPEFLERYLKVGIEMGIPLMIPGGHMTYVGQRSPDRVDAARALAKQVWDAGLPVLDDLNTGDSGGKGPEYKKTQVIEFLRTLKPGVTQFIVHCTRPTEVFQYISSSGPMRLAELEAMLDPEVAKVVKEENIILTTWRELKQRRDQVKEKEQTPAPK